jgi:hypothetical protein
MTDSKHTVGASREVMEHHDQMHRQRCTSDLPAQLFTCPCASCAVIICGRCDEPVFVAISPGSEVCEHAYAFLDLAPEAANP